MLLSCLCMFIHTLASNQTGILSLYSVSCCLYPRRLTLVPSTGQLLLVYSDWITEAIRGCKLAKLLNRAVCVEAWGTAVMWRDECSSRKLWSKSFGAGVDQWLSEMEFNGCTRVLVCTFETIQPVLHKIMSYASIKGSDWLYRPQDRHILISVSCKFL